MSYRKKKKKRERKSGKKKDHKGSLVRFITMIKSTIKWNRARFPHPHVLVIEIKCKFSRGSESRTRCVSVCCNGDTRDRSYFFFCVLDL